MSIDLLLLLPLALGHIALFVLIINVAHAVGYRGSAPDLCKIALLTGFTVGSGVLAWEACRDGMSVWSWPSLLYGAACVITGLFLLPLSTTLLHLRNDPEGIRVQETTVDLGKTLGVENLVGEGKYAWMLKLKGNESFTLRKIECELALPNLPEALDGLTLLHISDIHLAPSFSRRFFEAVIEEALKFPADLVLFTGDLVDDDGVIDWVVPLFSKLRGRLGTYSILGNHDFEHSPDLLARRLEDAGFTDLEGRWTTFETAGTTVALAGTSFPWGPPVPIADRPRADYQILLSHAPDRFYWAEKKGFDLMLSGHNHGGQIRFPLIGAVFMPSVYSRRFDRGFFRKGKLTLHVSQGIAGKHPLRYGCPPEITRLTLKSIPVEPKKAKVSAHSEPLRGSLNDVR